MKIGLVLSKAPAYSETFFNNKIKGLQKAGFKVVLFVQNNNNTFNLCETKKAPKVYKRSYIQFFKSLWVFITLLPYAKRLVSFLKLEMAAKRSKVQIVKNCYNNAHILKANVDWLHFGFGTLAIQSEHVAKAIQAKLAVSFRGFDVDVYPLKHPYCYKLLWTKVDKVHVISNYILGKAKSLGLPDHVSTEIIAPSIDIRLFNNKIETFSKLQKTFCFLTVGRLHWIKGLIDTMEGLSLLKQKGISFNYIIIGEGHEFESLKFASHQLDIYKEVKLIGKQAHEMVVEYMAKADYYLQYSHSEGFCNAVLEAQAMGSLCIVSDAEGLSENVLHNKTGWVVPKRNPKALAEKIEEIINLPNEEKNKIANLARQRIENQFNLKKHNKEWLNFYNGD